jgi:16S rRNA C967 or C1407 C5-methylase (RsmB/RsmF family)/NOL1/NOP2/fmu family ribosome biogenesis protein
MQLPKEFEEYTRSLMGEELYSKLISGLAATPPVSIRLNPFKVAKDAYLEDEEQLNGLQLTPVPWAKDGYLLSERPSFTLDPLFHAGAYYVQEASSMFLDFIIRQLIKEPVTMLDLCAAPGGKTTCAMAALPEGSILYSNEPIRTRANILAENVMKFGHPDIIVTNNYAKDYAKAKKTFDVILTDVPCSGEGMFRKDPNAINEWSTSNVDSCWKIQRSIVEDIWQCLKPGGILIYSTCTFNAHEDEENVQWIIDNLGADPIALEGVKEEWNITGTLKGNLPVYRFIPGKTKGEGLFMAVMRKKGEPTQGSTPTILKKEGKISMKEKGLKVMTHGINPPTQKGKKTIPDISLALSINQKENDYPHVDVDRQTAINYLRREAITLPANTPRGIVTITYKGLGLGFANNIGNRANNLYPQEWRIKTTHV